MPELIREPTRVAAAGEPPKLIDEYVGRVNTGEERVSVAHMRSPAGWLEPGQRPDFDEYTVVLDGWLRVEHSGGARDVQAGQAVLVPCGECDQCVTGTYHLCATAAFTSVGVATDGGWAQEVLVPERCLVPLPDGVAVGDAWNS